MNTTRNKIVPIGRLVEVNGHSMHVYVEGDNQVAPLLVFLSGAGTAAPVYDFKPLYSLLSDDFRIAVVEKIGYGYSGIADVPRDIDTVLLETRAALSLVGESGPYILIPHSMSGLEALRWSQLYPKEVAGIIGIDMAIPSVYIDGVVRVPIFLLTVLSVLVKMGAARLLPVSGLALTAIERKQAKLLFYRNAVNKVVLEEAKTVLGNANVVNDGDLPNAPLLQLVSNGKEISNKWIAYQEKFAEQSRAGIEYFDCGHYLHQHEPGRVADLCRTFISKIVLT